MKDVILRLLEKNSKINIHDMAIMLGQPEDAVAAAIAELEADQVICGYPTLIDWDKTGEERLTALIEVKVTPQRGRGFDEIAERIYKFDEVETVFLMSGGFDLTVIIKGKTMREVATFVSDKLAPLDSVLSTATHFVLKRYKENGIILHSEKADERQIISM